MRSNVIEAFTAGLEYQAGEESQPILNLNQERWRCCNKSLYNIALLKIDVLYLAFWIMSLRLFDPIKRSWILNCNQTMNIIKIIKFLILPIYLNSYLLGGFLWVTSFAVLIFLVDIFLGMADLLYQPYLVGGFLGVAGSLLFSWWISWSGHASLSIKSYLSGGFPSVASFSLQWWAFPLVVKSSTVFSSVIYPPLRVPSAKGLFFIYYKSWFRFVWDLTGKHGDLRFFVF